MTKNTSDLSYAIRVSHKDAKNGVKNFYPSWVINKTPVGPTLNIGTLKKSDTLDFDDNGLTSSKFQSRTIITNMVENSKTGHLY